MKTIQINTIAAIEEALLKEPKWIAMEKEAAEKKVLYIQYQKKMAEIALKSIKKMSVSDLMKNPDCVKMIWDAISFGVQIPITKEQTEELNKLGKELNKIPCHSNSIHFYKEEHKKKVDKLQKTIRLLKMTADETVPANMIEDVSNYLQSGTVRVCSDTFVKENGHGLLPRFPVLWSRRGLLPPV